MDWPQLTREWVRAQKQRERLAKQFPGPPSTRCILCNRMMGPQELDGPVPAQLPSGERGMAHASCRREELERLANLERIDREALKQWPK